MSAQKTCFVAYATRELQYLWTVALAGEATIADAVDAARRQAGAAAAQSSESPNSSGTDIPWETAPVGVFGEARNRSDIPADGDRIEIYRPLRNDPRDRRRERVQRARKAASR